jgi:hypothetical protein
LRQLGFELSAGDEQDIVASKRAAGRNRDLLEIPLLEEFRKVYEAAKPGGIRKQAVISF